ncbi:uncharacterized protein LOC123258190 [Drosophila ananassae]|uniref:uncharacterized protein LOC123258190 n=1 Tax=Drosophila ananassae TaxID=7217 RepID=UPI001D000354|nr:uncharacterized protein LOC123258190 [Drosophila ananassae]
MSWEYREVKQEIDSDDNDEVGFSPEVRNIHQPEMNADMIQAFVANAVSTALVSTKYLKNTTAAKPTTRPLLSLETKFAVPLLTAPNTVLNFDAILARLDCTYADKTSLRVLRQNLEMVQQGDADLMAYYDEVERKLTLVTNKIVMSHNSDTATILNKEANNRCTSTYPPINEASFNSETITSLLKNQYSIDVVNAPPLHSSSNGQVERITIDDEVFEYSSRKAVSNDSVYLNLNYAVNKSLGIAASPLINIMGHDHILSLPLLQRLNEHNLRLMQELRDDVSAGGSPKIWFAARVAVSLALCG